MTLCHGSVAKFGKSAPIWHLTHIHCTGVIHNVLIQPVPYTDFDLLNLTSQTLFIVFLGLLSDIGETYTPCFVDYANTNTNTNTNRWFFLVGFENLRKCLHRRTETEEPQNQKKIAVKKNAPKMDAVIVLHGNMIHHQFSDFGKKIHKYKYKYKYKYNLKIVKKLVNILCRE